MLMLVEAGVEYGLAKSCASGKLATFPLDGAFFFLYPWLMAFADFSGEEGALQIFRESLIKNRLAHAYLISGGNIDSLDDFAVRLARILICEAPSQRSPSGVGLDFCGQCRICQQIIDAISDTIKKADENCVKPESKSRMIIDQIRDAFQHADVSWVRPVSKSRMITIDQICAAENTLHLKARSSPFKVVIVSGADRMNVQAQNAFLKTLEEPPARSVILLLSAEPQRLLDTIVSRCLRIRLGGAAAGLDEAGQKWLIGLCEESRCKGTRGKITGDLIDLLNDKKSEIEKRLTVASPLKKKSKTKKTMAKKPSPKASDDLEPDHRKRIERELAAAIESEYRRQRADLLLILQWFLRDVWLHTLRADGSLLRFPEIAQESRSIADRISPAKALENIEIVEKSLWQLQNTNVQEALPIEVAIRKISL